MEGWIKLHRSILESDTYNSLTIHQKLLMIEILLRANFTDAVWFDRKAGKRVSVSAGQIVTSVNKIKTEWLGNDKQISDKKIRNTLEKLQKLGFLSTKTTNNYTLITVCKYKDYQADEMQKGKRKGEHGANERQTNGRRTADERQQYKNDKNEKNEKNDKNEKIKEIIGHLNKQTGSNFKANTAASAKHINARLSEGFSVDNFKYVIDVKTSEWLDDPNMSKYLRPATLFGTKFEDYLNQVKGGNANAENRRRTAGDSEDKYAKGFGN
ncbi:conserved phage C-terminal domain-containing protein [Listeria seeligeri]|uniref:conserved phage C-terminal domain-containing protein n=1 Tax=Listeria seeligeri TaxID=1640 RepID=UPI0022EBA641|nr:conserved phage C-terminal domain-containing protein [Listeria seeligeri]